jgi:peptidoglycan/xylan/chitin deacetylase (PgdA/CDA1 family)
MHPRRNPVPRARDAWVWLGGVALLGILGAGVTAAAVVLWENIDIRQLAPRLAASPPPVPRPQPFAPAARPSRAFDAVVFESQRNRAYFPDSTYYRAELAAWTELVVEAGGFVRRTYDAAGLRALALGDVLVLVEAPCLSGEEVAAVRAHLGRGGSVVSNWAVGARDADCAWSGWQTTADLTGASDVREIPARRGLFLTVPAGIALSAGLDPGTRIELLPDPSIALRVTGARVYWSDWALNPAPAESGGGADAAAWAGYSPYGGRIAWFGLHLSQAVASDVAMLRRLVQNALLWAAGTPRAVPAPWPEGRRAAAVFTLDVEDEARNAYAFAELLGSKRVRGTFYVVSDLVAHDVGLGSALAAAGEVGTQTSDHMPVAGLTPRDQTARLARSWSDVATWVGRGPGGIHPPEESFDEHTLSAWAAAGGTYLLATNEARSAAPEVHVAQRGKRLVLLPRLLKDDYNIIVQDGVLRATGLAAALHAGTRKLHAIGGIAVVASHTQIMRPGGRLDALASVIDSMQTQGDWWIASASEVAEWWLARSETRVRFASADEISAVHRLTSSPTTIRATMAEILVEAPLHRDVSGLWIDVVLPLGAENVVPALDGRPVDFVVTEWGIRVPVPELTDGSTRRISLLLAQDGEEALFAP